MGDLATRSLADALAAVTFVRDEHATLRTARGPKWAERLVSDEIARRAVLIFAAIPAATRIDAGGRSYIGPVVIATTPPTKRNGQCMCCGDEMLPYRGGQCELCERALARALEVRQ